MSHRTSRKTRPQPVAALPRRALRRRPLAVALAALALAPGAASVAADRVRVADQLSWDNPLTWAPVGEPRGGEDVFIAAGATISYAPLLFPGVTFNSVVVGRDISQEVADGLRASPFPTPVTFGQRGILYHDLGAGEFSPVLDIPPDPALVLRTVTLSIGNGNETVGAVLQRGGRVQVDGSLVAGGLLSGVRGMGYYRLRDDGGGPPLLTVGGNLILVDHTGHRAFFQQDAGQVAVGGSLIMANQRGTGSGLSFMNLLGGSMTVALDAVVANAGGGPSNATFVSSAGVKHGTAQLGVGRDLVLGRVIGAHSEYETFAGASLAVGRDLLVADGGLAEFHHAGGSATVNRDLVVARGAGAIGTARLLGTAALAIGRELVVGEAGSATFEMIEASQLSVAGNTLVGRAAGGLGALTLAGDGTSVVSLVGVLVVGDAGQGTLRIERGVATSLPGGLLAGYSAGGTGTIELHGGAGVTIGSGLVLGAAGTGTLTQAGSGAFEVSGLSVIGQHGSGIGMLALDAGSASFAGGLIVADSGRGTLNQRLGTLVTIAGSVVVGREPGSVGVWDAAPGSATLIGGGLTIGDGGQASHTGGNTVVIGDIVLGARAGATGSARLGATARIDWGTRRDLVVGDFGRGELTADFAQLQTGRNLVLGRASGGDGTLAVAGVSALTTAGDLVIGEAGQGRLLLASATTGELATLAVGGEVRLGVAPGGQGLLRFDAATAPAALGGGMSIGGAGGLRVGIGGQALIELGAGTHSVAAGMRLAEQPGSHGELRLIGSGSLTLTGALTMSGGGGAQVLQDGPDVLILGPPGSDLVMSATTGSRSYTLRAGRLEVANYIYLGHGSFAAEGGQLAAGGLAVSAAGSAAFERELALGGAPGPRHGLSAFLWLQDDARLSVPTLSIHGHGEYLGSRTAQLRTSAIVMDGGRVLDVLQNTGRFHYAGGSFVRGAGLINQGSVDLAADLDLGFLDNTGRFEIPAGRRVAVLALPPHLGGSSGRIDNRGALETSGLLDAYGMAVAGGASFAQLAGSSLIREGGLQIGSTDPGVATLRLGGGSLTVLAPVAIGLAGPASAALEPQSRLEVGHGPGPGLHIGPQGSLAIDGAQLGAAVGVTTLRVDAGGLLQAGGLRLMNIDSIDVAGRFEVAGSVSPAPASGAAVVHVLPGGVLRLDLPAPAAADSGVGFTPAIINEGSLHKSGNGAERSLLSGSLTQNGTLQVDGTMVLGAGGSGSGSGSTHIAAGGRLELTALGSWPADARVDYAFGGALANDGMLSAGSATATTIVASLSSSGAHSGGWRAEPGGTLRFVGGAQTFAGGGAHLAALGGTVEIIGGTLDFDAGSLLQADTRLNLLGGSVRMNAASRFIEPLLGLSLEGSDLELSTGTPQSFVRAITLGAGAFGGADPVFQTGGRFDWHGGALYGPGELLLHPAVGLTIDGPATKQLDRRLSVGGAATWQDGDMAGNGVLALAMGSDFLATAANSFAPSVEAGGSFVSRIDAGTARYLGRFDARAATLVVERGGMRLSGGGSSDSPFELRSGASIEFAGGEFVFDGPAAQLAGTGTARFSGGRTVFRNGARYGALGGELIAGGILELGPGSRYTFNPSLAIESGGLIVSTGLAEFTLAPATSLNGGILAGADARRLGAGSHFSWLAGTLGGPGSTTVEAGASLLIDGSGAKSLESDTVNAGVVQWNAGSVGGLVSFANLAGGEFLVAAGGSFGPAVDNAGLMRVNNGPGSANLTRSLRNTGRLQLDDGTLQVSGSLLNLTAGTLAGGVWSVAGTLRHSGSDITTIGAELTLNGAAASLRSAGNVDALDSFAAVAAGATLRIEAGRNFVMNRNITLTGRFEVGAGSNFTASGGTLSGAGTLLLREGATMSWTRANLSAPAGRLEIAAGAELNLLDAGSNHEHAGRNLLNQGTVHWSGGDLRGGGTSTITNAGLWLDEHTAAGASINHGNATPVTTGTFTNTGIYRKSGSGITNFINQILDNSGRVELTGGVLNLDAGGFNRPGGVIDIAAGRTLKLRSGLFGFAPGSLVTGAGALRFEGSNSLPLASLDGALSFSNLVMANGLVVGSHSLEGRIRWLQARLGAGGSTTIAPGATLLVEDAGSNHEHAGRNLLNQGTVHWSGGDLRGGGTSTITNAGLWLDEHTAAGASINHGNATPVTTGTFTNTGIYRKSGSGITRFVNQRMDNAGRIEALGGRLELLGGVAQVTGNRLTGGAWEVGPGATLLMDGVSSLTINEGSVHLRGPGSVFAPINALTDNRGEFRLSEGRNFTTAGNLLNSGLIFAGAGSWLTVAGTLSSTGTLAGGGEIQVGLLSVAGPIDPGASPGRLGVQGDLAMLPGSSLRVEIAGLAAGSAYDWLQVSGRVALAGALRVELPQPFAGLAGASFAFLTAGQLSGQFDGLADGMRIAAHGIGGSFAIAYTPSAVYLHDFAAPVPEPRSWAMLAAGAALLLGRLRRRRRDTIPVRTAARS